MGIMAEVFQSFQTIVLLLSPKTYGPLNPFLVLLEGGALKGAVLKKYVINII